MEYYFNSTRISSSYETIYRQDVVWNAVVYPSMSTFLAKEIECLSYLLKLVGIMRIKGMKLENKFENLPKCHCRVMVLLPMKQLSTEVQMK